MKRCFAAFLMIIGTSFLISSQANAQAVLWQEGTHYKIIADEVSKKPVVKEYFSFWCPACYAFEPIVKQMKEQLPADAQLQKIHVNFMPMAGPKVQDDATKAMLIARTLKKEDELNAAIFNYIHRQRATLGSLKDLRSLFIVNGVEPETFDKVAKGFSVNSLVKRNNKAIGDFREHIRGVPTFIINDKYIPIFPRQMTAQQRVDLVLWLLEQK